MLIGAPWVERELVDKLSWQNCHLKKMALERHFGLTAVNIESKVA